jgi:mRNA interferase RelE/StbE
MKIIFLSTFLKDIKKIKDPKAARMIEKLISNLKQAASLEDVSNVKKMKGYSVAYKIKSGNYRMGIYKDLEHIELARFLKIEDIYKVFPQ